MGTAVHFGGSPLHDQDLGFLTRNRVYSV